MIAAFTFTAAEPRNLTTFNAIFASCLPLARGRGNSGARSANDRAPGGDVHCRIAEDDWVPLGHTAVADRLRWRRSPKRCSRKGTAPRRRWGRM